MGANTRRGVPLTPSPSLRGNAGKGNTFRSLVSVRSLTPKGFGAICTVLGHRCWTRLLSGNDGLTAEALPEPNHLRDKGGCGPHYECHDARKKRSACHAHE